MKIGGLAEATGTPVETIRFYEREGLLPAPARSEGNYRLYTAAHAERLAFIRQCRHLDMTLDEVRALLRFRDAPSADCGAVNDLLDAHISHAAERIRGGLDLQSAMTLATRTLMTLGFKVDYVTVRNAATLAPPQHRDEPLRILAAAWLGKTRLIDNVAV